MDFIRPKSGNLRIQNGEDRQKTSKIEQIRFSKQICKSINILPIKIQTQHIGSEKQTMKTINYNVSKHNFGSNEQLKRRKTLLSIKSKHSLRIDDQEYINNLLQQDEIITQAKIPRTNQRRSSVQITSSSHNIMNFSFDDDSEKIFQLLKNKKQIMMLDHNKLIIQASKFKLLLNDFQNRFKQVKTDRDSLQKKVNKYEYYFKQMRLKHVPDEDDNNVQTNHQLKILNLQKKVQTLNYIIKQYRTGNNEQVKNFQQKLKQFKPNIQKELTQKLAQTNQKYQKLLKKVQFFESQCQNSLKLNWHQLMDEFQATKQSNQKNLQYISQLTTKLQQFQSLIQQTNQKLKQITTLQQQTLTQKQKIQLLNDKKYQLQELIDQKDKKIDELNHLYEETTFKLQGLQNLQFRIQNKEKTIKKNTIVINRLQCENIQLKSKMDTVLSEFQQKLFCEKSLQSALLKANNDIHQLTNRLHETFIDLAENSSPQATRQKQFFIGHLFEKVKSSYNEIIAEYQNQLKLINAESQKWKTTFDMITKNQQQKIKHLEKINQEIKIIQDKKLRCQNHFNNLSNQALDQSRKQCINCKHFIAYWGQLQNSYNQLRKITSDVIEMQSMNLSKANTHLPTQTQQINC